METIFNAFVTDGMRARLLSMTGTQILSPDKGKPDDHIKSPFS